MSHEAPESTSPASTDLRRRYREIGISAVAAAVRYVGTARAGHRDASASGAASSES